LRCGAALSSIPDGKEVKFFGCVECHRQYALKANGHLVDRWGSPISLVIYPIIYSRHPQDDVERVVEMFSKRFVPRTEDQGILEEESVEEHQQKISSIVSEIRAELAKPTQPVREILELAFPEVVGEEDVRAFLRGVSNGLAPLVHPS
jgi:hypothetical protein